MIWLKCTRLKKKALKRAVRHNIKRIAADFMFQLMRNEWSILISQFVISSWGGTRKFPFAFKEQGIAMLSGVLNSDIAIKVNKKNLEIGYKKLLNKNNNS